MLQDSAFPDFVSPARNRFLSSMLYLTGRFMAKKTASAGKRKVHKVMHEFKQGSLKSSSGKKIKSRKQAVAVALSEARSAGAHIPKKKSSKS